MTTLQEINDVLEKELEVVLKVKDNYAQGYKDATKRAMGLIRSHPYQSHREKVLELLRLKYVEFLNHPCPELADKYDHCCDADWCGLCTLDEVLAELWQAGEPDA